MVQEIVREMGIVIDFPAPSAATQARKRPALRDCAEIVILPVIRIERYENEPATVNSCGKGHSTRKRQRRVSRS